MESTTDVELLRVCIPETLYSILKTKSLMQASVENSWVICICAIEIYCEKIRDLLVPDRSASECTLVAEVNHSCHGADERTVIRHQDKTPLCDVRVRCVADAMQRLSSALQSRTVRATECAHYQCFFGSSRKKH